MTTAAIHRIRHLFCRAFHQLSLPVSDQDIDRLSLLVQQAMAGANRKYHTAGHLFDMAEDMAALPTLATLFHDVVCHGLDGGIPPVLQPLLAPLVDIADGQLMLRDGQRDDGAVRLCCDVFGLTATGRLSLQGGGNELLSAMVAITLLQHCLSPRQLLTVAACIEATIPFRGAAACQRLARRLAALPLPDAAVAHIMADAVLVANRDVMNFASASTADFLANTWPLIGESCGAAGAASICRQRQALAGMAAFLARLDPDHVFHAWQHQPDARTLAAWRAAAAGNLQLAVACLEIALLGMALLEALALLSGGDCAMALLGGSADDARFAALNAAPAGDPLLLALLSQPYPGADMYAISESALTRHVYCSLGPAGCRQALPLARQMFAQTLSPAAFLASLPPALVRAVATACAGGGHERSAALMAL